MSPVAVGKKHKEALKLVDTAKAHSLAEAVATKKAATQVR